MDLSIVTESADGVLYHAIILGDTSISIETCKLSTGTGILAILAGSVSLVVRLTSDVTDVSEH